MSEPKIAVTFDLGYLSQLALVEAFKLEPFKGKTLTTRCVFSDPNADLFNGIEVYTSEPDPQ